MAALFLVEDPIEVNVLLRALFAAKFHAPADGLELAGSPILACLCERAMEAFAAAQEAGLLPGSADQTRASHRAAAPGEPVLTAVREHLSAVAARGGNWGRWSPGERAEYVRLVLRPYVADEAMVRELAGAVGP